MSVSGFHATGASMAREAELALKRGRNPGHVSDVM
jgi:hypothetical protein